MKLIIGLLAICFSTAYAETKLAYVCNAECLGVNVSARSVEFLGNVQSTHKTRAEAWKKLNKQCLRASQGSYLNPLLAKGSVYMNIDQSFESSSWFSGSASARSSFYYSSATARASGMSRFEQDDRFVLEVTPASPSSSCSIQQVSEEDLIEYYDGDLQIFG